MAYTLLFLKNYNNYFNRTVKRLATASEYEEAVGGPSAFLSNWVTFENVNFVPNDGVSTSQVINWAFGSLLLDWQPDYMIAFSDDVFQRWFVVESKRLRNGQYQFSLKRDTLADYLEQVGNANAYVVRGFLPTTNPLIYNPEGISFNQIKQKEYLLTDKSGYSFGAEKDPPEAYKYVVGYFGKDNFSEATQINVAIGASGDDVDETIDTPIDEWNSAYLNKVQYILPSGANVRLVAAAKSEGVSGKIDYFCVSPYASNTFDGSTQDLPAISYDSLNDTSLQTSSKGPGWDQDLGLFGGTTGNGFEMARLLLSQSVSQSELISEVKSERSLSFVDSADSISAILAYNGKIIQDSEGNKYRITAEIRDLAWYGYALPMTGAVPTAISNYSGYEGKNFLTAYGRTYFSQWDIFSGKTFNSSSFMAVLYMSRFVLTAESLMASASVTIPASAARTHCADSAFDIFVIPTRTDYQLNVAISIGQEILAKANGPKDLQLLPFSPIQNRWHIRQGKPIAGGGLSPWGWGISGGTDIMVDGYHHVVQLIFSETSQASFTINRTELRGDLFLIKTPTDPLDLKVANETEVYRLAGPNYSSVFEFSPYKNGGLESFDVDCAFKPYQPYIHMAPHFGYLYGGDFNDIRGLTLTGDFSLDQVSDAWETYQLNNKNYQLSFDRQIDSLELNQHLQRVEQGFSAVSGTIQGAAMGTMAGAQVGGGVGAIVGGVIGGVASGAAAIADWATLAMSQGEQMNAQYAYFSNSLGNIKAIPRTVSKVNAFNPNNKIWPVLEVYSCTDTEKELLENLITSRSMAVGAVMPIGDFIHYSGTKRWLQAQPIKLEDLSEDSQIASDIYQELAKGVYI